MTQEPASLRRIIKKAQKVDFLSSEGFLMTKTAKVPVRCGLSGTALKYIACITMLIDLSLIHI